jgi:hypothetical protein
MKHQQPEVISIAIAPNEMVAQMWQQVLRDEGIIAALKPGGIGQAYASNALNEHYVLVRQDQAERARAIIDDFESDDSSESDSMDDSESPV